MKTNKIERKGKMPMVVTAIAALALLGVGTVVCYDKLKALYLEQCVITNLAEQVSITSGKMVKADVIAENLGLRKGANLATIDFSEKRRELLATASRQGHRHCRGTVARRTSRALQGSGPIRTRRRHGRHGVRLAAGHSDSTAHPREPGARNVQGLFHPGADDGRASPHRSLP